MIDSLRPLDSRRGKHAEKFVDLPAKAQLPSDDKALPKKFPATAISLAAFGAGA